MTDGFDLTRDGEVARLTLTRPEKMNAITYGMWAAIPDVVAEVEADPALKVLVIAGAGKHFSAGADISEFGELRTTADGAASYDKAARTMRLIMASGITKFGFVGNERFREFANVPS